MADALGRRNAFGEVSDGLRSLPREGVHLASAELRSAILEALRRDAGSDRRLSGLRSGKAQTVKVTARAEGDGFDGYVMAAPRSQRAPWFWLEEGTAAGFRGRPNGARRRNRGSHPGTPAKSTWSRGVDAGIPAAYKHFDDLLGAALEGG